MSTASIAEAQSRALLDEIEQQIAAECRAIHDLAQEEAARLIADAHHGARARAHDTLSELRRQGARRLARAGAQLESDTRKRKQERVHALVERAWPMLAEALIARWRDRQARDVWIAAAARYAEEHLPAGTWAVIHPNDFSSEDRDSLQAVVGGQSALTFRADGDLQAGLRIETAQAALDATAAGLLADHETIAAMLLSEIDRHG